MRAMEPRRDRRSSFRYVAGVYAAALVAAAIAWNLAPLHPLLGLLAGLGAASAVTYVAILRSDCGSVFDPWWSVLPPFAALWLTSLSEADGLTPRQLAVHTVVWFWGIRLTWNWARGWPGLHHEDWRYVDLAARWPLPNWAVRALAVVGFPTLIVWLGCLPLHAALAGEGTGFGLLDLLALALGLAATSLELVADEQMWSFSRTKQPGELMDQGLWALARHPNYLGEICFWVSLWLFGVAASPAAWWTGVGALAMIAMFRFASIPMLDERSAARRPAFAAYAARTPALLPWPRRAGADEGSP